MRVKVEVQFDTRELVADLGNLARTAEPKIVEVLKKNADELQRKEKRDVPVDTGFLKRSITVTSEDKGLTVIIEPTADYARYVEYGTRYMAAQPYVRSNVYEQTKQLKKDMEKFVK